MGYILGEQFCKRKGIAMAPDTAGPDLVRTLERIKEIVGPKGWSNDAAELAPLLLDRRGNFTGQCALLVRPASTEEVAQVVTLCAKQGIAIVPQGGNTGVCGGATPHPEGHEILLALGRMNRVRDVDPLNYTMTVDAGCILADIQKKAEAVDRLFPLSLGAEGSCQIGGNLSTNAGGVAVLRYGNSRDLVLGLEVVLPDGQIWHGLRGLRKDNRGYDLKQLFVGAEGTLGIITAAVLKLFPSSKDVQTAFAALTSLEASTELLTRARAASGDAVTSFELIPRIGLDFALKHVHGTVDPLQKKHDWHALIEFSGARADGNMRESMEVMLSEAAESALITDATIAASGKQRDEIWLIREAMVEAQAFEGASVHHDVSVPVRRVPEFIHTTIAAVTDAVPGIRPVAFGHLGDGNIHFNLSQPTEMDSDIFRQKASSLSRIIHDIVHTLDGSFSAEHGIGQLKREELKHYKSALELDMMRRIRAAFDPKGLMNPEKGL